MLPLAMICEPFIRLVLSPSAMVFSKHTHRHTCLIRQHIQVSVRHLHVIPLCVTARLYRYCRPVLPRLSVTLYPPAICRYRAQLHPADAGDHRGRGRAGRAGADAAHQAEPGADAAAGAAGRAAGARLELGRVGAPVQPGSDARHLRLSDAAAARSVTTLQRSPRSFWASVNLTHVAFEVPSLFLWYPSSFPLPILTHQ